MTVLLDGQEKSEYYSSLDGAGNIASSGRVTPGLVIHGVAGTVLIHDQNQNEYLGKINSVGAAGDPLPPAGTELVAGDIYTWGAENVIVRQDHVRTEHDPETVPALFSIYRAISDGMLWIANEPVLVGDDRKYPDVETGVMYEALQNHTTQVDWTPDVTPTLWKLVAVEPGGAWAYPVAYNAGDEVGHLGIDYACLQPHTSQQSWAPDVTPALWSVI